ncbi:MAG: tetratricopeptide repeat protein [Planctomycetales bacterium]
MQAANGHEAKAEGHYRQGLEILPGFPRAHRGLAAVRLEADQTDQALEELEHALRTAPDDWEVHRDLIKVLLRLGRREDALHHAQEAVRVNPALPPPALLLREAEAADEGDGAGQP